MHRLLSTYLPSAYEAARALGCFPHGLSESSHKVNPSATERKCRHGEQNGWPLGVVSKETQRAGLWSILSYPWLPFRLSTHPHSEQTPEGSLPNFSVLSLGLPQCSLVGASVVCELSTLASFSSPLLSPSPPYFSGSCHQLPPIRRHLSTHAPTLGFNL